MLEADNINKNRLHVALRKTKAGNMVGDAAIDLWTVESFEINNNTMTHPHPGATPADAAVNTSADSSQPINILSESPLSITWPASFEGVPDVPVANSISGSAIVVTVDETVVVVPDTVKFPAIVTLPNAASVELATVACGVNVKNAT